MSLTGKVVMMCGAGPGVGRALAKLALARSASVALLARTPSKLQDIERELACSERTLCVPTDVADTDAVRRAVDATLARFGRIDMLVQSILPAHLLKPVLDLTDDDLPSWRTSVNTSIFGALAMSRAVANSMTKRREGGAIVFITATSALQGYPAVSAHAAGKAGIHALAQCLAAEWGPLGIRVNCVAPGIINGATVSAYYTDPVQRENFVAAQSALNATRRMPTDVDVAEAALFLGSDAAAGISGQILSVDGGRHFH